MVLFLFAATPSLGQLDTEFWFAPPELTQSTNESAPRDRPIQLVVSTLEKPGTVRILQPADLTFEPIILEMEANSTRIVNLTPFINRLESKPENTVLNTGILIQSTASISAYYEIRSNNNTDIFSLKGANANGRLFFTPFQTHWHNSLANGNILYNPTTYASFDIVATDDTTHVTITPTKPLVGHPAGVPFTITLNRGQVYSCRAIDRFGYNHPAGSKIESDKDIAVTVKDDMLQFNPPAAGADIAGDQIIPVDYIGTDYVVVRGGLSGNNDRVYFTAVENNTIIRLNGIATPVATLNQGEQYELVMDDPTYFVKATKKVYAWHISGIADQVGGALIPALSCTGTNQIGFARTNSATYVVNVITKESAKNNFTLNGNPNLVPGSAFSPIQGSNGWVYARITFSTAQIPAGTTLLLKNNSDELFHVGVSNYAVGVGSNYGYFSNFSRLNLGTSKQLCIGDTAVLDAGPAKTQYLWNTGATTRFLETSIPGKYWVNTLSGTQCPKSDTVTVRFYAPNFNIGPDDTMCIGETRLIQPPGVFTFTWQDGSTGTSFLATQPGLYWAQVADFQGCTTRDSLIIFESPRPATPIASGADTVCEGQMVNLTMNTIPGVQYQWMTPSQQVLEGQNISITVNAQSSGKYKAFSKIGSCLSLPDSANVGAFQKPMVSLGKDTVYCGLTGTLVLDPGRHQEGFTYQWSDNTTDTSLVVSQDGTYSVTVVNSDGCSSSDTIQITFQGPTSAPTLFGDTTFCQGENAVFGANTISGYVYQWSGPGGFSFSGNQILLSNAQPLQSGLYQVTPFLNGCSGPSADLNILINQSPQISLGPDVTTCLVSTINLDPIAHSEGLTFLWNNNSTDSTLQVTAAGTYSVAVSNGLCTSRDTIVVQFGIGPANVTFTGQSSFCQNTDASFGVVQVDDETYIWTGPNGFSASGNSVEILHIQPGQAGVYSVIPEKDGCPGNPQSVTISILPAPIANLGPDTAICPGGTLILDPTPSGGEETFYVWSTGAADSLLVINQTGTYHVLVTDGFCSSTDTIVVSSGQPPSPVTISGTANLCSGSTLDLSVNAQTGVTYNWAGPSGFSFTGSNLNIPNIQTSQSGFFKVTYSLNGCKGVPDSVMVNVFPYPVVNLGNDLIICQGGAAILQAGPGGFNYLWNDNSTDSLLIVTAEGQYFVTVSSGAGLCVASDTIQVTFGTAPSTVTFTGTTEYCSGNPAIFGVQPEPGITYQWIGPNGFSFTGPQISINNIQTSQAGTYQVIPSLGNCIGDTFSIQITISPGPAVNLGPDQEICGFQPITLNAGSGQAGLSYLWNSGSTDSTLTVNQTGTYIVVVSSPGCEKSDTIHLTFKPIPLPVTIEADANHCSGDTLQVSLQGIQNGVTYNWTGPNGFSFQGTAFNIPNVNLIQSGLYSVTPILEGCEGIVTSVNININPKPMANLGLDLEACLGTSFTLDPVPSSNGLTFLWNTGSTDSSIVVSQSGQYIVKVTNSFNCSSSDTILVTLSPVPVNLTYSGDSLFCTGQSGSLSVSAQGNLVASWTGPGGFSFIGTTLNFNNVIPSQSGYYVVIPRIGNCFGIADSVQIRITDKPVVNLGPDTSFCGQDSYLLSVDNPLNNSVLWSNMASTNSILVAVSGTYYVTVSTGACSNSDTVSLSFNQTPAKPVTGNTNINICEGSNGILVVDNIPDVVFQWSGPNGFEAIGNPITISNPGIGTGAYTVVANKNGCKSESLTLNLEVKPSPALSLTGPEKVCKGNTAQVTANFTQGASILWSDLTNQPTGQFGPGKHWATVTLNGCTKSDTILISNSGPKADFTIGPDSVARVYQKVLFLDKSISTESPVNFWEWKLGYSQIQNTQNAEFTYSIEGPVKVQLLVRDAAGCADTIQKTIIIQPVTSWFIPTLFTPNGDNFNETFVIVELDKYPGTSLNVYDRWGKEVFSSSNYQNDWKGDDLKEGVYYFAVKRSDGQSFNGYFLLKR